MEIFKVRSGFGFGVACTAKKHWGYADQTWMVQEQTGEFASGVATDAGHSSTWRT
jgi:hypothetical protein